jgi:hypothetical protein
MYLIARIAVASLLLLAASAATAHSGNLSGSLETGAVWFSRNDVRVPGDGGDKFDLTGLTGTGPSFYGRAYLTYEISQRNLLRLLIAPLEVDGSGRLTQPTRFRDTTFESDTETRGLYKFSTYRITYRRNFHSSERWDWGVGGAVLVRDARITLEQGEIKATESNVGFVPLLHLYGLRHLGDRASASLDVEGLGAPQGRAVDAALTINYQPSNDWTLSAGYRTLEGGADNDKVYTFAWLHYVLVSANYRPGHHP